ncbi:MAG: hypothetical protein WAV51_00650 [Microgenomates group bacterium]
MERISRLVQRCFPYFFLFIVVVCSVAPVFPTFTTAYIGDGGDSVEMLSYLHLAKENLQDLKFPLAHTNTFRYPDGFSFDFGSDQRLFVVLGAFGSLLINNDVIVFNSLIVGILLANCITSYVFFTLLAKSRLLGLLGAVIYGLSYYPLTKIAGHINLMQLYSIPVIGIGIVGSIREKRISPASLASILLGFLLAAVSSLQTGAIVFVGFSIISIIGILLYPQAVREILRRTWKEVHGVKLLCIFFLFIFLFIFLFPSHVSYIARGGDWAGNYHKEIIGRSIPLFSDVLPSLFTTSYFSSLFYSIVPVSTNIKESLQHIGAATFWGYVELLLFIFAVFFIRAKKDLVVLLNFIVFFCLTLGPEHWPSILRSLYFLFPLKYIMETDRYFLLYYFMSTIIIVRYLTAYSTKKVLIGCILAFVVFERLTIPQTFTVKQYQYEEVVGRLPGKAVLDVPVLFEDPDYWEGVRYNLEPFAYKKKIVSGYFHWMGETEASSAFIRQNNFVTLLRCGAEVTKISAEDYVSAIQELVEKDIQVIVIHKDYLWYRANCKEARMNSVSLLHDISMQESRLSEQDYAQAISVSYSFLFYITRIYADEEAIVYLIRK